LPVLLISLHLLFRDINFAFIFGYKLIYFIIGGGSYYLWKNLVVIGEEKRIFNVLFLAILLIIVKLSPLDLSVMIWVVVFFTALYNYLNCQNGMTRFVSFFLLNSMSRFFGKISYSIYLNHMIVIYGLLIFIQRLDHNFFNIGESIFLIFLFTLTVVTLTVVMSSMTYQYI
jgi:peptidoglycan/LPS O-acetylase OafA/YrhL